MGHSESKCSVAGCKCFTGEYAILTCGHMLCYAHAQPQMASNTKKLLKCGVCGDYRFLRTYWLRCGCQVDSLDGFDTTTELKGNSLENLALRCKNKHSLRMVDLASFFRASSRQLVISHLSKILQKNPVSALIFHENGIGDGGTDTIAALIEHSPSLLTVDLSQNLVSRAGTRILAQALVKDDVHVMTLDLSKNAIGNEGVKDLAEAIKKSKSLSVLCLSENSIEDEGTGYLAEALETSTKLTQLNLSSNKIQSAGAESLAAALGKNASLNTLVLSHNQVSNKGVAALAASLSKNRSLAKLALAANSLTPEGMKEFGESLSKNETCKELDLHKNPIGDAGVQALVASMRNVETLNLEKTGLTAIGARTLAESAGMNALVSLNLRENIITDEGAKFLAAAVEKSKNIGCLIFYHCNMGDGGAKVFGAALQKNSSLKTLDLSFNHITEDGAKALAQGLEANSTLSTLDLSYNFKIGPSGAQAIAVALAKNTALRVLNMRDNKISDSGAKALAAGLVQNQSLLTLILLENNIGNEGIAAISSALEKNQTLTALDLSGNNIGAEGILAIAAALEHNTALATLSLGYDKLGEEGVKEMESIKACLRRNADQPQHTLLKVPPAEGYLEYRRKSSGVDKLVQDTQKLSLTPTKEEKKEKGRRKEVDEVLGYWIFTDIHTLIKPGATVSQVLHRPGEYMVEAPDGSKQLLKTYGYAEYETDHIAATKREFEYATRVAGKFPSTTLLPVSTKVQTDEYGITHIESLFEWPGDVGSKMIKTGGFPAKHILSWMHTSLEVLSFAQTEGIPCSGMTLKNLYYDPQTESIKVTGFGDPCGIIQKYAQLHAKTPSKPWKPEGKSTIVWYVPPEVHAGLDWTEKSLVYMWGITFCQIFRGWNAEEVIANLEKHKGDAVAMVKSLKAEDPRVEKLLELALTADQSVRPSLAELLGTR